ncbi:MAG: VCBS repeat-containing protein [Rhodanobacteraceae bacterium]|nr:VCBS repeat-containing protein [Rhodanobacteraceae bacterium]
MNRFFAAVFTALAAFSSSWAAVPTPIHQWRFDEFPDWHNQPFLTENIDSRIEGYLGATDLQLVNAASAARVAGHQGRAVSLDGIDDYLALPATVAQRFGGTFTLSCWLRTNAAGGTSAAQSPGFAGSLADGTAWGWLDAQGRIGVAAAGADLRSSRRVNDERWHHLVITRNSVSGRVTLYVDGVLEAQANGTAGPLGATWRGLGRLEGSSAGFLRGRIDEISVFGVELDQSAVFALRRNHAPKARAVTVSGGPGTVQTPSVLFQAFDPDGDALQVVSHSAPGHGSVTHQGDGSFAYTNAATTDDAFDVVLGDGNGGFVKTTVVVNYAPVAPANPELRTTNFTHLSLFQAAGSPALLPRSRVPRFIDIDGDGDQDLLVGHTGAIWLYENTGNATAPDFSAGRRAQAAGTDITPTGSAAIALADLSGDARDDLVVADESGRLRVYPRAAGAGAVFSAAHTVKAVDGSDFVIPDRHFDVTDWNADGHADLLVGSFDRGISLFLNRGTAFDPRFDRQAAIVLTTHAYNSYPRATDLLRTGRPALLQSLNWGSITYWPAPLLKPALLGGYAGSLSFTASDGSTPSLGVLLNSPIPDFADLNGDGALDVVLGGHSDNGYLYLAFGRPASWSGAIAALEAIYDAHPNDLGAALTANNRQLLEAVKTQFRILAEHVRTAAPAEAERLFAALSTHIAKYPFLRMDATLDISRFHLVPAIASQTLLFLSRLRPDTAANRTRVTEIARLSGKKRRLYEQYRLLIGDNQRSPTDTLDSYAIFMSRESRELFPDSLITVGQHCDDQLGDNGNSALVDYFDGGKNVFCNNYAGYATDPWASDLKSAITAFFGATAATGDATVEIFAHEATHSLDAYVNGRANQNLRQRWGQLLVDIGGPEVRAQAAAPSWISWPLTQEQFRAAGLWNGDSSTWSAAWDSYWQSGAGATWNHSAFMRGSTGWFLVTPQETLATQGNQHWVSSQGRFVGAVDRFRRSTQPGGHPQMKHNMTEVVLFLDMLSVGLNKIPMYTTHADTRLRRTLWTLGSAWIERNDAGLPVNVDIDCTRYALEIDTIGRVTGVNVTGARLAPDSLLVVPGTAADINVLANDVSVTAAALGTPVIVSPPAHGSVSVQPDGSLRYVPAAGYRGLDGLHYSLPDAPVTCSTEVSLNVNVDRIFANAFSP